MMTITATNVEYHDTIGGACSCESNTLRYGHHTKSQHACVENFLVANAKHGRNKRDMVPNINFFMNVPVEADGALGIVDGISAPGKYVDLRAEIDVMVIVSNCPQINNPCNGFNPTPVRMIIVGLGEVRVQKRSHRQSRRYRLPHHTHAQGNGCFVRRGLFRSGCGIAARVGSR